ncbi:MAG: hypothetical protein ABSH01_01675 [Terriglobia bacterium]|jgi:hypothetical protein
MKKVIDSLFTELEIHPVLMDVGALERPPEIWDTIARHSIYVGLSPEAKLLPSRYRDAFYQVCLVDSVVTTTAKSGQVPLYLTKDPVYSSLLEPKQANSTGFLDWAAILERELMVPGTTVNALMGRLALTRIDWLHTNVNGVDLRLYQSIEDRLRRRILALDTVLDLVDFWVEQGSPLAAYQGILDDGFWLSRLEPYGFVKMRPESLERIRKVDHRLDGRVLANRHRRTPGWIFARFFRTIDSLTAGEFSPRDCASLWAFALLDGQVGFAADVAFEYERIFGADHSFQAMLNETVNRMRELTPGTSFRSIARKYVPKVVRRGLRRLLPRDAE